MCGAWKRWAVTAAVVSLAGCGGSTAPSQVGWDGVWNGTVTDLLAGTGSLQLTLSQSGDALNGTIVITITSAQLALQGTLTGTVSGDSLRATAVSSQAAFPCTLALTGTRAGNTLNGTYTPPSLTSCAIPVTGSFAVTKQ